MSRVYDNWERLVRATLRREQLRRIALRTPSDLSLASPSSFNFTASSPLVSSFNLPSLLVGEAFEYDQILRATNYLSNSNLIKHGHTGDLFYGVLDDGIRVAIKRIDLSSTKKELCCRSELDVFANASHSRLVPLLGHCWENSKEKVLVYKYMSNRDLWSCLFGKIGQSLDWTMRLKIATGAAEALCYLHHECIPPLVHRDVRAGSIFLDDGYDVRLGSLGDVCAQEKGMPNENKITRFLRLPWGSKQGTSGPGTSNATCAYDVYCFGKVLLELVTGKLGFSAAVANDSTVNDWMGKTLPYIPKNLIEFVRQISDPSLIINECRQVWGMAVIAKACLNSQPSKRPLMASVLEALQDSQYLMLLFDGLAPAKNIMKQSKIDEGDLEVYVGQLKRFSLRELQAATDYFSDRCILGRGAFSNIYKGSLADGSMVAVKSYKVHNRLHKLQFKTEVKISKVEHRNLLPLRGFCLTPTEQLLVYPYMVNGSVASCLRERPESQAPLDWPIRKRIALGAARGLACLHNYNPKIISNAVKTASILLDEEFEAVVGGFGVAVLMDYEDTHVTTDVRGTIGHIAPECLSTGEVLEKYDVFAYGFMLLELVSGQRAFDLSRLAVGDDTVWLDWVKGLLKEKKLETVVDADLQGNYIEDEMQQLIQVALICAQSSPAECPKMSEVVRILEGDGLTETWEERQKEERFVQEFNDTLLGKF